MDDVIWDQFKGGGMTWANAREKENDRYMFSGNRIRALQRDGYRCVMCGITEEQHLEKVGRGLSVDHIDGRGSGVPRGLKNNSLDNLQTLCHSCHQRKDYRAFGRKRPPSRYNVSVLACKYGHEWLPDTILKNSRGWRACKLCKAVRKYSG